MLSCLAGALTSYTMLPPLPGCPLTLPLPSHWPLAWMSSSASFWFCQHMPGCPSGVAFSSPAWVLTSHASFLLSPLGRVLVPSVGQPPLAITHLPLLLLPTTSCMCLPCSAAPRALGLNLRKEGQTRRDTGGRGPGTCFNKLSGDLYTHVQKSACDPWSNGGWALQPGRERWGRPGPVWEGLVGFT